jgi:hypothetical protein
MSNSRKLHTKPCPFCGSLKVVCKEDDTGAYCIECYRCCATGQPGKTRNDSIAHWEQRPNAALATIVYDDTVSSVDPSGKEGDDER